MTNTYAGPLMAEFVLTVPGTGDAVTVTQERSKYGIHYIVTTPRGSMGRDNLREAFVGMTSAHRWECRVRDHKSNAHSNPVVSECVECVPLVSLRKTPEQQRASVCDAALRMMRDDDMTRCELLGRTSFGKITRPEFGGQSIARGELKPLTAFL